MYEQFVIEIDAIDNGVEISSSKKLVFKGLLKLNEMLKSNTYKL